MKTAKANDDVEGVREDDRKGPGLLVQLTKSTI